MESLAASLPALLPVGTTEVFRLLRSPPKQTSGEPGTYSSVWGTLCWKERCEAGQARWTKVKGVHLPPTPSTIWSVPTGKKDAGGMKLGCRMVYGILCHGGCLPMSEGFSHQQSGFSVEDHHTVGHGPAEGY